MGEEALGPRLGSHACEGQAQEDNRTLTEVDHAAAFSDSHTLRCEKKRCREGQTSGTSEKSGRNQIKGVKKWGKGRNRTGLLSTHLPSQREGSIGGREGQSWTWSR